MAQILLISDTDRVKRVFTALENEDALRIRTAATLVQADQEMAAAVPDITFVQSRISGFSGDIILRHLRKVLPEDAAIVLLAADAADLEQALRLGELHLDLANEDEALSRLILQVVAGGDAGHQEAAAAASTQITERGIRTDRKPKARTEPAQPVTAAAAPGGDGAVAAVPRPMPGGPPQPAPPEASGAPSAEPKSEESKPNLPQDPRSGASETPSFAADLAAAGESAYAAATGAGRPGHQGQEAHPVPGSMLAEALAHGEPLADLLLREERKKRRKFWFIGLLIAFIAIPVVSYLAGRRAAPPEPALAPGANQQAKQVPAKAPAPAAAPHPAPPKAAAPPGTMAPPTTAVPPKAAPPARPGATPGPAATAVPAAKAAGPAPGAVPPAHGTPAHGTPVQGAPAQATPGYGAPAQGAPTHDAPAPGTPAPKPANPVAPAGKAPAGQRAPAVPAAKPGAPVQGAPPPRGGARSLPAVVAQAKVDPAYGKAHPGWQRYLGNSVEYRVLQEAGQYRALQVASRNGQPIPDQFFAKLLLEFGGVTRYQLASSAEKGQYLVEQGSTSGGMAVTTYRDRNDRRIREFQLSYR